MILSAPRRSNCLLWCLGMRLIYGGEIRAMRSPLYPGPRFLWRADIGSPWYTYAPRRAVPRLCPPWRFPGRVEMVAAR